MHPRLAELLPEVAVAAAADDRVHVFVGIIESGDDPVETHAGADFVVSPANVQSVEANEMDAFLAATDPSSLIVEVTGVDQAAVIAGQVNAIASGVRALVTDDVVTTRRITIMIEQVLNA